MTRRIITCQTCEREERPGYCAKTRCYCNHPECSSHANTKGNQ